MIAPALPEARAVLVADPNRRNVELLTGFLGAAGFEARAIATLAELDVALLGNGTIRLALVDAGAFDFARMVEKVVARGVPLLVFSDRRHLPCARRCLAHGARGVLQKPLLASELLFVVRGVAGACHEPSPPAHRT